MRYWRTALLIVGLGLLGCSKKTETAVTADPQAPADPPRPAPPPLPSPTPKPNTPGPNGVDPAVEPKPADPMRPIPAFVPYNPTPTTTPMLTTQPPPPPTLPPPPPITKTPEPKEKTTGSVKLPEWPKEINGRSLPEFIKDTTDSDPAIREMALRTIPKFGPTVRKEQGAVKAIIARMDPAKESDPGVRAGAYECAGSVALLDPEGAIGFPDEFDTKEAVRLLFVTADQGVSGGGARLHAIQKLGSFGSKAEPAVTYLVGRPAKDIAYETRRAVAFTLGQIGYHEYNGPNSKALGCLADLTHDPSASVRLEALQSIIALGPPFLPRPPGGPLLKDIKDAKDAPKVDEKEVAVYLATIRKRLLPAKGSSAKSSLTGLVERDPQVEIYTRMAMMRLDPKEMMGEEHLDVIAKYVAGTETAPKLHALSVLGMMGKYGAKKLQEVVNALSHEDPLIVSSAVNTLMGMGADAAGAIPALEKLKNRPPTSKDKKEQDDERKYWAELSAAAVKYIREASKPAVAPAPGDKKP